MDKNFSSILNIIENNVVEIKTKYGISIEPLNDSLKELKRHTANISKIEDKITEIQEEVLKPIQEELTQNKKASKFSILGFYIGMIGLIVSIITIIFSFYLKDNMTFRKVNLEDQAIQNYLLNGFDNMELIDGYGLPLIKKDGKIIAIKRRFSRNYGNKILDSGYVFYINWQPFGNEEILKYLKVFSENSEVVGSPDYKIINFKNKDSFSLYGIYKYQIINEGGNSFIKYIGVISNKNAS